MSADSLAKAPFLMSEQSHRLFADYLSQARQIETITDRFDIRPDSRLKSWPIAEPNEGLVANLFLHRDKWVKILNQIPLKSPLRYYYITSPYGMRTNQTGVTRFHHGWISQHMECRIVPSASGIVSFAGRTGRLAMSYACAMLIISKPSMPISSINVATGDHD